MGNGLALADYIIIGGFFAVMLGIGLFYSGRVGSMSQFFGGGKRVPWWLGGVSFYMVSFSALAFVMYAEMLYKYGFVTLVLAVLSAPAAALSALWFARRWRRVAETSPLEYIETRYGPAVRQSLMWLGLPTRLLDDSLKLFAIGTVVSAGLGFPFTTGVVICASIILLYTFMGGLWAALVADLIQFIVLVAAVLILPVLAFQHAGGVGAVMDKIPPEFYRLTRPDHGYPLAYLACIFLLVVLNYSSSWALVQRYYSCESDRHARKVGYSVALLYTIGTPIFYIPALAALVFLPGIANTKEVYPLVCKAVLPVGMLGMVIAAMFSATMSTLAGEYNAMSSVLTNDLYKRYLVRNASDRHLVVIGRINTVIVGLIVVALTLLIRSVQGAKDLFDTMTKVFGLTLPPVAIPMIFGMLTPRVSSAGARTALFGGVLFGVAAFVLGAPSILGGPEALPFLRRSEFLTFFTTGITLTLMAVVSFLVPDTGERRAQVLAFFERFRADPASAGGARADLSFLPVVAVAAAVMGLILIGSVAATAGVRAGRVSIGVGCALLVLAAVFWMASRRRKA